MSARVCYISRQDRGALLTGVRLIGRSSDESWSAPREVDPLQSSSAKEAASWIADHLGSRLGGKQIDRLCLDVDGAVCGWVDASSATPQTLRAVIDRESGFDDAEGFGDESSGAGRFPGLPNEVSYQALGVPRALSRAKAATTPGRAAVLAVPEVAARALMDGLDEAGVQVGACVSLWQAMAGAWAPDLSSDGGGGDASARVIAENTPLMAAILNIPGERVVWAWIRGGVPVAAGAFRSRAGVRALVGAALLGEGSDDSFEDSYEDVHDHASDHDPVAGLGGRLAAEWLAWSAQLGAFPSRVTWIGPIARDDEPGLEPAQIAGVVRKASPDATVDVIDEADPVGLTLRRLAERLDDGPRTLESDDAQLLGLSNRPGRVHRAMYQWIAVFLVAASVAIGATAYSFWQERAAAKERVTEVRGNIRALLEAGAPELVNESPDTLPLRLRDMLAGMRGPAPVDIPAPKPVLRELETLAFVLGQPNYNLEFIDVSSFAVTFKVRVDDTRAYENLQQSLLNIGGSQVRWTSMDPRQNRDKIDVSGSGMWREDGTPEGDS